ncbi:hypothetical protein GGR57DRAFT_504148 [Xylariaceae sp. FL1272]|nr:hypothetical protein GGR57DRAFT_504148 [Xylariaceae sp. FL1272]
MTPPLAPRAYTTAPTRQEIISSCPGLLASPTQVRDWFSTYLAYRGLDPTDGQKFIWRGIELHRATFTTLVDAFRHHCGKLDWEADVLAYDESVPPPQRTMFQRYVEKLFGYEFYSNLMQWSKPNLKFLDYANCVLCWGGFSLIHAVLLLIIAVVVGFLLSS